MLALLEFVVSWDMHILVQCVAVNMRFLFIISKDIAGNVFIWLESMLHITNMSVAHLSFITYTNQVEVTNNSYQIK